MSNRPCHAGHMIINRQFWFGQHNDEILATFGGGQLVKRRNGKLEFVGGTRGDYIGAIEWCSLFHHGLVFSRVLRANPQTAFAA